MALGAVLLAAGAASRMGHRPKCLLELDGVPLVHRQLLALLAAGVGQVVVVLGHYADRIAPVVSAALAKGAAEGGNPVAAACQVSLVRNPNPDAGQNSSLRLGLEALQPAPAPDAVLVALADQPLINLQDMQDLLYAFHQRPPGTRVVQPLVEGLRGNPVVFDAQVRQDILAGDTSMGCRQWQSAHPQQVHLWHTANSHYRTDVDSPQDLEALAQRTGLRLQWPADSG